MGALSNRGTLEGAGTEGPDTQYLRFLASKTGNLKYWVLGPSGLQPLVYLYYGPYGSTRCDMGPLAGSWAGKGVTNTSNCFSRPRKLGMGMWPWNGCDAVPFIWFRFYILRMAFQM